MTRIQTSAMTMFHSSCIDLWWFTIGLGQGNDILSGTLEAISTSTIAGGKATQSSLCYPLFSDDGGDRERERFDGDEMIPSTLLVVPSSVPPSGAGNDSLTWSGTAAATLFPGCR